MIVTAARRIEDGQVLMVGTQWPIPVALLAKRYHAPRSILCFEGGLILEDLPERVPLLTGDADLPFACSLMGDCLSALGAVLHKGLADLALLTAAHVDRFGNLNTTCVGPYAKPRMRFGGSGGACDFGSLARETLIVVEQNRLRFPAAVDFITTPVSRRATVVTTMGQFLCEEGGEMMLTGYRSDLSPASVQEHVQWRLRRSRTCRPLPDPTPGELRRLREEVDPLGLYLSGRKQAPLAFLP
jgi:glutaconate CoA-transferase, subunit B